MYTSILSMAAAIILAAPASAHMAMTDPAPLRGAKNQFATNIDYSMTSPLSGMAQYPCKGYLADADGKESVASWQAGSDQTTTISGGAVHEGGSCQLSLSYDDGATFKVIKSFEGGCPAANGDNSLAFTVPTDAPAGDAVFAWTWNNKVGNREMYMNCAMVTIEGGSGSGLDSYPDVLVAQINDCKLDDESASIQYPDPGEDVEKDGSTLAAPTGSCGATSSTGGSSDDSGSGSDSGAASSVVSSAAGAATSAVAGVSSAVGAVSSAAAVPTTLATSSVPAGVYPTSVAAGSGSGATGTTSASTPASTGSASSGSSSSTACTTEGEITCNDDGTWSECGSGMVQNMGTVPAGMSCSGGAIVAANSRRSPRFGNAHRRRHVHY